MIDSLIETEILAACSSLGYSDGNRYYREADCLETVKDLIRYLRRDDDSHQIRRSLGETKVLQTDLIPLITHYHEEWEIFDITLRLLVNLTNPVVLLFKEELPEEKVTRQQYLQIVSHQQAFKEAFADEGVWKILATRLGEILNKDWDDRDEEERLVVERILILARNILVVASSPEEEKRTDDDASIHDQVLWALHLARFEDILLYIASSKQEQDLCMHVMEIISLMLKEQDAAHLANAGLQRLQSEKEKDEEELMKIRRKEAFEKQEKIKRQYTARHSRFGGTYYVNNMKSISDRTLIAHKHVSDIQSLTFDTSKRPKKIPKNRLPLKDVNITRKSTLAIRLFLQEFCIEFLNGAYNSLMSIVKDRLERAKAEEHDESYYLWSMKFFLEFNRCHNFRVDLITEGLNIQSFHYIQTLLDDYYERMSTDKKKIPLWSRRMHKALNAYKELLLTLTFMDKSESEDIRESSKILKNKVFYIVEYRELVLTLLQNYDELKMSKRYLVDLIETSHIFLKLLDGLCGKQKHFVVAKKGRKKSKRPKVKEQPTQKTEEQLIMDWETQSSDMLAFVKGEMGDLPLTIPFDSVSEVPEEDQKEGAMKRINQLLRDGQFGEGLSLLRSSRELWPDGDIFGNSTMDPIEEMDCLRTIYMANINSEAVNSLPPPEEEIFEDSDEQEDQEEMNIKEQEFDKIGFIRRFSHIKVMQAYALAFKRFFSNPEIINHAILKMFHRLAWDCKIVAVFFQGSIFRTFHNILNHSIVISQSHKDAIKFAKFIVRSFVELSAVNDKLFVEILFWKTNKDALEIECGYGTTEPESKKSNWTEEEEQELARLYEEFKDAQHETKDCVELITENLINQKFTRRMVIQKLKKMGFIQNVKELTRKTIQVSSKRWTEEEVQELTELFEEFKDAIDPLNRILDRLSIKKSKKNVKDKILELGLVSDKSALYKKRSISGKPTSRKSKPDNAGENFLKSNGFDQNSDEDQLESDESQSEDEEEYCNVRPTYSSSTSIPTPELIKSALQKVINAGLNSAVKWLSELLLETAEEREEDNNFEPVPILCLTDESTQAMENDQFLELMRVIGIRPPSGHQEMFWRIPSNISIEGLKKRSQYLVQGASNVNGNTNDTVSSVSHGEHDENILNPTGESNLDKENVVNSPAFKNTSKRSLKSDSESEKSTKLKKRRIVIHSDDEDEESDNLNSYIENNDSDVQETGLINQVNISPSKDVTEDFPRDQSVANSALDSDDEVDVRAIKVKKSKVIDSDDDSE